MMGEDYEPDKPMINFKNLSQGRTAGTQPSVVSYAKTDNDKQEITDKRLEEIKIEYYNRKFNEA